MEFMLNIKKSAFKTSINNAEIKKEVDLDGDGKNEIFYMLGNENNIVLTEQKGKVYYLNFGTFICTKFIDVLKIKDIKRSVALILSTGTNGLNSELMYLIGLKNGKPEITFCTAESYKCELIDLDKDGVNEILCSSKQIIYGSSWPIIYKWNGETLEEFQYISMRNSVTIDLAYTLGFKDVSQKTFIKKGSGSVVSYVSKGL